MISLGQGLNKSLNLQVAYRAPGRDTCSTHVLFWCAVAAQEEKGALFIEPNNGFALLISLTFIPLFGGN